MLFAYKAQTKTGEIVEGVLEARDRFAASRELRAQGETPRSIKEQNRFVFSAMPMFQNMLSSVSTADQILLLKNLSGMLKAGLSLSRALLVLQKQTKNNSLTRILATLSKSIDEGETLSSGLAKFPNVFSKLFISMTRAGEESGNLPGALTEIGLNLEKSNNLTKKVKGALIYPGVILSAMVVMGVLMFAFVVPTLARTFKELHVTLPSSTRFIIFLGNFFSTHLGLTFLFLLVLALVIMALVRAPFMAKYIDFFVLHIPVIGELARELNTARTARTIASLLLSGVSIIRSIEIAEDVVQNTYYKRVLEKARIAVERGAPFSQVFEENPHLYPVMMAEMTEVGEETGKLSDMLIQIADFYEGEIDGKTKNLSTIIEPFLMIIIGGGVGFFAISMISPLYSILDNIK